MAEKTGICIGCWKPIRFSAWLEGGWVHASDGKAVSLQPVKHKAAPAPPGQAAVAAVAQQTAPPAAEARITSAMAAAPASMRDALVHPTDEAAQRLLSSKLEKNNRIKAVLDKIMRDLEEQFYL